MSHKSRYSKHDSSSSSSASSSPERDDSKHSFDTHGTSPPPLTNVFANDGSFLEMFKKYQQKQSEQESVKDVKKPETSVSSTATKDVPSAASPESSTSKQPPVLPLIGKRRGGKILPTGKVKKLKNEEEDDYDDAKPKDAWSVYMSEVKRYRETVCQSDDKTRPLVK